MNIYRKIIESYILYDDDILGAFYGGSIARNESDKFSDIDLRIIIKANQKKCKILKGFINLFDNILFVENQTNEFAIVHLENLLKIDVLIFYKQELMPSIWFNNILIVKDKDFFLSDLKKKSDVTTNITSERLCNICNKYLAYLIESYKRYQRDELFYLQYAINMMTNSLCHLWYLEMTEEPNSLGDWSKYEGRRSKLSELQLETLNKVYTKSYYEKLAILNDSFLEVLKYIDIKHHFNHYNEYKNIVKIIMNKRIAE